MPASKSGRATMIFQAIVSAILMCAIALFAPRIASKAREFLAVQLQGRFPRSIYPEASSIAGIIVLGGSHARVVEGFRLAREYANAKLLLTGASPEDDAYAKAQYLPGGRLIIEPYAKTTFQNAIFSRRLLHPSRPEKWIIVTSAFHMPRAIGTFRQAGFSVVPWPVFDHPNAATIPTTRLLHEFIGLLVYRAAGRSDSAFPAPIRSHASTAGILTSQKLILR